MLALFMALGGGAYAAIKLPANSVGSKQIKSKAVTPAKVAPATVKLFKGQKGDSGTNGTNGTNGRNGTDGTNGSSGSPALSGFVGRLNNLPTTYPPGGVRYGAPSGTSVLADSVDDTSVSAAAPNASSTARDLFVQVTAAPGSGADRGFELVVNGSPTSLFCEITDAATTCNSTQAVSIPAGATLSIRASTHCCSPAAPADARFGWRATTP
jgi:hypothetical protein